MSSKTTQDPTEIRNLVRQRYGSIAADFTPGTSSDCSPGSLQSSGCCSSSQTTEILPLSQIYETPDAADLPDEVKGLSLGCGDPIALASIQPGETVLDLGSGGGIDCFLAAQRVGPTGRVIGVDMTAEMVEKARSNQVKMGSENVEFRLGEIEHLPVADQTVDLIISNCVINLSPNKPQVFREAYRVLKPGGRLAVSDMVTDGPLPKEIKESLSAWAGCVAGALDIQDYIAAIEDAGFIDVEVTPVYMDHAAIDSAIEQLDLGKEIDSQTSSPYETVFSAKITARKP